MRLFSPTFIQKCIITSIVCGIAVVMPISVHNNTYHPSHDTRSYDDFSVDSTTTLQSSQQAGDSDTPEHQQQHISRQFTYESTYATGSTAPSTSVDLAITLESILKVVYVILWPLLWLAGQAMDNSLIYGEFLGIDEPLFKFWQMMKNFANFALGFLFLWSVISYVVNPTEKKHPKDMIVKLLIAGVSVQLSWFIVGTLVDLSTVMTTGLGGLPLHFMGEKNNPGATEPYIFGLKTSIKLNEQIGSNDNIIAAYTLPGSTMDTSTDRYILPCYSTGGRLVWGVDLMTAYGIPNQIPPGSTNIRTDVVNEGYCVNGGSIISFDAYKKQCDNVNGTCLPNSDTYSGSLQEFSTAFCGAGTACQTISTIVKKSEGYQNAFYSLYSSLLNLGTIHIGVAKSDFSMVMETLIKTIIALAYIIPLLILAIILIMRVGYMWLVIAFSPFIALTAADLGIKKLGKDGIDIAGKTKFSVQTVISLLMLPVVVTFALSLSIVFMSALSEGIRKDNAAETIGVYSRTEGNYRCYDIAVTDICIDTPSKEFGGGISDYFGWLLLNFFGIGMMWFVVMAALKSSDFTKGVAEKAQGLSESLLGNLPIIPLGGGSSTSLKALSSLPSDIENRANMVGEANKQVLSNSLESFMNKATGKDKAGNEALAKQTQAIAGSKDVTTGAAAVRNLISSGAFSGDTNLRFSQYKGSTEFAKHLATAAGMDPAAFNNGSDLFRTTQGQEVLAKLSQKTGGNEGFAISSLRNLFSGSRDRDTDRERTSIANAIQEIKETKYKDDLPQASKTATSQGDPSPTSSPAPGAAQGGKGGNQTSGTTSSTQAAGTSPAPVAAQHPDIATKEAAKKKKEAEIIEAQQKSKKAKSAVERVTFDTEIGKLQKEIDDLNKDIASLKQPVVSTNTPPASGSPTQNSTPQTTSTNPAPTPTTPATGGNSATTTTNQSVTTPIHPVTTTPTQTPTPTSTQSPTQNPQNNQNPQ